MKKRTVIHKEGLNVKVKFKKEDFTGYIYKDVKQNKEYLMAGTLIKVKSGNDIRKTGDYVESFKGTGKADAILVHDVELKHYRTEETGAVTIEGIAYIDKIKELYTELEASFTVDETMLPEKITYLYKERG